MGFNKGLFFGLVTAFSVGHASAQVLAEYNFDGASPAATSAAAGITAGTANFDQWDGGLTTPGFSGSSAFARTNATNNVALPLEQDLSEALANDNYLSFTIDGTGYSVSSIAYAHSLNSATNGASYVSYLFTSKTGFADGDQLDATLLQTGTLSESVNFDTSGIASLQGLSEQIEVRIYLSDDRQENGEVHFLDSITVSGVPEPGSLALMIFGGVCLCRRPRRR